MDIHVAAAHAGLVAIETEHGYQVHDLDSALGLIPLTGDDLTEQQVIEFADWWGSLPPMAMVIKNVLDNLSAQ